MPIIENALIVGGGIAGLTAAITLGRQGVACEVLETRPERDGAAITIQNRAINAMSDLGLLDEMLAAGAVKRQSDVFRYFDKRGEAIPTPPMPPEPENGLPSAIMIHRRELARILRRAAEDAGTVLRDGTTFSSIHQDADRVSVTLDTGETREFDFVIAADGVGSATRSAVFGSEVVPQYSGTTMLRWVAPDIPDVGQAGFYQAEEFVVLGRLRDGSVYLATGRQYDQPPHLSQDDARTIVRENLELFESPLTAALLERLDDSVTVVVNDYRWLILPDPWYRGRVLAIGDAAHATTATLSSGGAIAIEDAVVLGEEFARGSTVEDALRRFMHRRFDRARMVVETSVRLDEMHQEGAPVPEQNAIRGRALAALRQPY